jgi:hypothetical protein
MQSIAGAREQDDTLKMAGRQACSTLSDTLKLTDERPCQMQDIEMTNTGLTGRGHGHGHDQREGQRNDCMHFGRRTLWGDNPDEHLLPSAPCKPGAQEGFWRQAEQMIGCSCSRSWVWCMRGLTYREIIP